MMANANEPIEPQKDAKSAPDSAQSKKETQQTPESAAPQTNPSQPAAPAMPQGTPGQSAPTDPNNATGQQEQEEGKKQKLTQKQKMFLIIAGIVLVCATIVIVVWMLRPKAAEEKETVGVPIVSTANVKTIEQDVEDKVAKGMFETYMTTTWTFPDGKSASSDAVMGNSVNNNYPFYFTITLSDTGETIFTSGMIPLGTQIAEIVLEKELEAGVYSAVIAIQMMDEGEPVDSNMGFNITLVIQN